MKKSLIIKGIISIILAGVLAFMIYSVVAQATTIQKSRDITQITINRFDELTYEREKKEQEECIPCKEAKEKSE